MVLLLAKGIVELHGGRIVVNSAGRDRGTESIVELPLEKSQKNASISTVENKEWLKFKDNESTEVTQTMDKSSQRECRRILIVEDEIDSASLLQIFLEDLGYQVEVAFNGIDGVALAQKFSPDLILSDINLTREMDGYTLARTIRNDPQLSSICLIAISGFGESEDKTAASAAGFDAHLTKPLDLEQIQNKIVKTIAEKSLN